MKPKRNSTAFSEDTHVFTKLPNQDLIWQFKSWFGTAQKAYPRATDCIDIVL